MAYRDRALLMESLGNVWQGVTASAGTSAAVATASLSVAPAVKERVHLTQLGWSIRNNGAAAYTATLSVKHASTGGTVIASWDITPAAAGFAADTWCLGLMGKKGVKLWIDFGTPGISVVQRVSAAGWRDTLSDG